MFYFTCFIHRNNKVENIFHFSKSTRNLLLQDLLTACTQNNFPNEVDVYEYKRQIIINLKKISNDYVFPIHCGERYEVLSNKIFNDNAKLVISVFGIDVPNVG